MTHMSPVVTNFLVNYLYTSQRNIMMQNTSTTNETRFWYTFADVTISASTYMSARHSTSQPRTSFDPAMPQAVHQQQATTVPTTGPPRGKGVATTTAGTSFFNTFARTHSPFRLLQRPHPHFHGAAGKRTPSCHSYDLFVNDKREESDDLDFVTGTGPKTGPHDIPWIRPSAPVGSLSICIKIERRLNVPYSRRF
ncbi:hypothetical protein EDB84DRAFT_1446895 [Lactarius hengduanensis]|nr:hypothetical protein EDB84DRAFT_1446895 [Lactarius hengduanensis]